MRRAKRRRRRGGQFGRNRSPNRPPRRYAPPLLCEEGNGAVLERMIKVCGNVMDSGGADWPLRFAIADAPCLRRFPAWVAPRS